MEFSLYQSLCRYLTVRRGQPARTLFFAIFYVVFISTTCSAIYSKSANVHRKLQFPKEYSIGTLTLLDPSTAGDNPFTCGGIPLGQCQGEVLVPPNRTLKFEPNYKFFQHPETICHLPENAFACISLQFTPMADTEDNMADDVMPFVHRLSGLKKIDMNKFEITDKGLAALGTMPELQSLAISDSLSSGSGFLKLSGCQKLRALRFGNQPISDAAVRSLKNFPQLERLDFYRANLNLEQLKHVVECKSLRHLSLVDNRQINDDAVPLILSLPKLDTLNLKRSNISVTGLEKLSHNKFKELFIPRDYSTYTSAEQNRLKKAYPNGNFFFKAKKQMDADTKAIFAPITR